MIPLMLESFVFLPKELSAIAVVGLVVAGIYEWRSGHIRRVGIFLNVLLLWQIFYPSWNVLPDILQIYLNIGTILMIVALISYLSVFLPIPGIGYMPLPTEIYQFAFYAYGSISILIVAWAFFFSGISLLSLFR